MTKRRALLIGLLVVIALPLLAVAGLVIFFPTDQATRYAVRKVEATTGRPLAIGGASVKIVPSIRLVLEDVVFGDAPAPGAPRVSVEEVALGVKLLPLLGRRVEVTQLTVRSPEVEAVLADSSAAPPPKAAPAEGDGEPGGVELRIDELVVTGGRVVVRTPGGAPFLEITGLEERLTASASDTGDLTLDGTTRIDELVLHVTQGEIGRGLPLTLTKSLRYDANADRLEVARAELDLAGVPIALTGHVGDLGGDVVAALALSGGPGEVASILGFLPAGLFPEMDDMESGGTLAVDAAVTGSLVAPEGPDFHAVLTLEKGRIRYPGLARAVEEITLHLDATPARVEITELAARSGASAVRAHATITDYRTSPRVRMAIDGDVDLADVTAFYPAAERYALAGGVTAQIIAEGPADDPEAFTIDGTLEAREVTAKGPAMERPVEGLSGSAVFDRDVVTLESVRGRIGRSDFTLAGRLENPMALDTTRTGAGRARGTFELTADLIDVDELMPAEPADTGGPGGGAGGGPLIPELPPLDATLSARIGNLVVKGLDARNVAGRLALDGDVLAFEEVTAGVFDGRAAVDGTLSLADRRAPTFDIAVDATAWRVADVFAYNRELGRLTTVAEHLTGTMSTRSSMRGALDDTLGLVMESLASDGDVWIQDATLSQHPVQIALSRFLDAERLKELAIEEIAESFTIRDGRLSLEELSLTAGPIAAVGSGWTSLEGRYELALDLWLPREIAEGARAKLPQEVLALLFGGAEAQLMLPVTVAGTRGERPSVALDSAKLSADAQARAAARLEAERQRLVEEAKRRAEAAAAALVAGETPDSVAVGEAAKEQVEEKVKDALKGIFGKKK